MKEHTKAYIAGLLDADGYLMIRSMGWSFQAHASITSTDRLMAKWLNETFGGNYLTIDQPGQARYYRWMPQGNKHAEWFLSTILPYLVIKKKEAELLLEYYGMSGKRDPIKRKELVAESKELKDRSVETDTKEFTWKNNIINAYYSGIFDGEGSCGVLEDNERARPRYKNYCQIPNAYQPILKALVPLYGGTFSLQKEATEDQAAKYLWRTKEKRTIELFLLKILPYLRIKREIAQLILDFVRLPEIPRCGDDEALKIRKSFAERSKLLNRKPFHVNKTQSDLIGDDEKATTEMLVA